MQVNLITTDEAKQLGIAHSILLNEGHGAFGEPDNSYEYIVFINNKTERLSSNNTDLILYTGKSPNREVLQVIREYHCSDKLLEVMIPEALAQRKKDRQRKLDELIKEVENDNK